VLVNEGAGGAAHRLCRGESVVDVVGESSGETGPVQLPPLTDELVDASGDVVGLAPGFGLDPGVGQLAWRAFVIPSRVGLSRTRSEGLLAEVSDLPGLPSTDAI